MISARDTLDDRLAGMAAGSDDYLTKPFASQELEARLRTLIRRDKGDFGAEIYRVGDLTLDTANMTATRAGQLLDLTESELQLLQILMRFSPAFVSRRDLARELWGASQPVSDALRSHLYKLRRAVDRPFDKSLLHTRIDHGYRIADVDASPDQDE
jgi:DNA-binding response OmpR family regulator